MRSTIFSSRCSFRGNIWSWTRMNVRKENENFQFRFNLTSIAFSVLRMIRTALHARNAFGERQKIVSSWNMRKLLIAKYLWASFTQVEGARMIMKASIEIFVKCSFDILAETKFLLKFKKNQPPGLSPPGKGQPALNFKPGWIIKLAYESPWRHKSTHNWIFFFIWFQFHCQPRWFNPQHLAAFIPNWFAIFIPWF